MRPEILPVQRNIILVVCSATEASHGSHQHSKHSQPPRRRARRLATSAKHARPSICSTQGLAFDGPPDRTTQSTQNLVHNLSLSLDTKVYVLLGRILQISPDPTRTATETISKKYPPVHGQPNIHAKLQVRRIHILSLLHASLARYIHFVSFTHHPVILPHALH